MHDNSVLVNGWRNQLQLFRSHGYAAVRMRGLRPRYLTFIPRTCKASPWHMLLASVFPALSLSFRIDDFALAM